MNYYLSVDFCSTGCLWMNSAFRAGISAENSCEPGVLLLTFLGCYPVGFSVAREVTDV